MYVNLFLIYIINQNEEDSFLEFIKNYQNKEIGNNINIINNIINENESESESNKSINKIDYKENIDLKNKINQLINENNDLKNKNNQLINENNDLKNKNNQLIYEYNDLKNKLFEKENDLIKYKLKNENLLNLFNNKNTEENEKKIIELYKRIEQLENENKQLIPIIFHSSDQKINHAIICKKSDIFNQIENELFKKYPEYRENDCFFIVNGNKINTHKTIEENKIKENDVIMMNIIEE